MTTPQRWRPKRAGIVNLYEYADQTFSFVGGRLLLRGHNTSGKTKALELLLPFCLDGDISARKLDPFARDAKDMKWNLVGCADREQSVGYVWLEFERLTDTGDLQRLTTGIGLRAHRQLPKVTRWYFLARDRRVGRDLDLLRGSEPIGRADLAAALGDDGEVLDTAAAYRERLNDLLFGFANPDQYRTMLRLMLELRRPHLSKTLDPDGVAELLSAGLPEVDETLMRRLAAGLEQLETLERGLARLRSVRERVRTFHDRTYRAYLRAVLRERAERLRSAQQGFETAGEALRAARTALDDGSADAARLSEELVAAHADLQRLEGEERALVMSAAWASVAEVEQLRERAAAQDRAARAREEAATDAAAVAGALEAELIAAQAALADESGRAQDELAALEQEAEAAGLGRRHGALAAQLRDGGLPADAWAELARELARDWRAVLDRHAGLLAAARAATDRLERARAIEASAEGRLRNAAARRAASEDAAEHAREALDAAVDVWRDGLAELDPTGDDLAAARDRARQGVDGAGALGAVADRRRREIAAARAVAQARRDAIEADRACVADRRGRLEAEHDEEPPTPPLRGARPAGRPGAPLWRLVEFAPDLGAAACAGLEAALEVAGILDAWVTPGGRLLDERADDVLLVGGPPASHERTLADVLVPVDERAESLPVAATTVRTILARIAVGEAELPPGDAAVGCSGAFRLGPLTGAATKPAAEYVGAAARAARRARLIAELLEREAELVGERDVLDAQVAALDARAERLAHELAAFPPADEVSSALRTVAVAAALESAAGAELEQARADTRAASEAHVAAQAACREHAAGHALPADLDDRALDARRQAAAALAAGVPGVARAWRLVTRARTQVDERRDRLAAQQAAASERAGEARHERAEAQRLQAEHAAREAALGADGAELRVRHRIVTEQLRARRAGHAQLADRERSAAIALAGLETAARQRETEHDAARGAREHAHGAFCRLGAAGLLALALGEDAPADQTDAARWPLTRALEIARRLPAAVRDARSASGQLSQEVLQRVHLLDRDLVEADMSAYAVPDPDGLLLVHVAEGPSERPLGDVMEALDGEISERERLLSAEERRVFSDALVEEIAEHLRQRIHSVRERVAAMNAVLRRSPTAAGKIVQLEWRTREDDSGELRGTTDLLRRDLRYLAEDDRRRLVEFFRARVEGARARPPADGAPEPMAATLATAFDYRRWFAFGLIEESDGRPQRLTRKRHAVGSGGEQSVLIHLPLFAAAAALYGDSPAPRLVMLDEALSGIDDETRERVLAATVALDLDVVMTSHELWATYRSVPGLAIYQLHRENGVFGVHAVPFVWDGDVLRELEQGELVV